jgi:hypothetical protein
MIQQTQRDTYLREIVIIHYANTNKEMLLNIKNLNKYVLFYVLTFMLKSSIMK